jgi:hypothetical protein
MKVLTASCAAALLVASVFHDSAWAGEATDAYCQITGIKHPMCSNVPVVQGNEELVIWIRAFIPNNLPITQRKPEIPGTVIEGPFGSYFADDQRGFSAELEAKSRFTIGLKVNMRTGEIQQFRSNTPTKEFYADGSVKCHESSAVDDLKFGRVYVQKNQRSGNVDNVIAQFDLAKGNPCTPKYASPDINMSGSLLVSNVPGVGVTVGYSGSHDDFPAFEGYASMSGGTTKVLFQDSPRGRKPYSLYGFIPTKVSGTAFFPSSGR